MRTVALHESGHAWTFAELPDVLTELDIQPRHVLHVGAHLGQEVQYYRRAGIGRVTLVEPTPANAALLCARFPDAVVIEAACGPEAGTAQLSLAGGDGAWNTIRPRGDVGTVTVPVVPIRDIQGDADMLVVDTQGTELEALSSADLSSLRLVVIEVTTTGNPEASNLDEVTAWMRERGWEPRLLWNHDRPGDKANRGFADAFFTPSPATLAPTWTIAIATLGQRRELFGRLLDGLMPQVDAAGGRVKVRACWDNGETPIAAKRQALVEATTTDYLSFIDDDDTVSADFVPAVLDALETRPDFVGFWMQVYKNGHKYRRAELSLKHTGWTNGATYFCRDITHENPMRTSILRGVDFRDKPDGAEEDAAWADKLRGLVRTESMIDRVLYHYWWVPAQSMWGRSKPPFRAHDPDGRPWSPMVVDSPNFTYLAAP